MHGRHTGTCETMLLPYKAPYQWNIILSFFEKRAVPGVELVRDGAYWRTLRLHAADGLWCDGVIQVSHNFRKNALELSIGEGLFPVRIQVKRAVQAMFDLNADPETIDHVLGTSGMMPPGYVKGIRVPGSIEPFEVTLRAIIGQQITVAAARTLTARISDCFGAPIETGITGLTRLFPDFAVLTSDVGRDKLAESGIIRQRAAALQNAANAFRDGLVLDRGVMDPDDAVRRLMLVKGIGKWTATYIVMRTMGWRDAFLETDAAVRRAVGGLPPAAIRKMAELWAPWRAYATVSLWNSL